MLLLFSIQYGYKLIRVRLSVVLLPNLDGSDKEWGCDKSIPRLVVVVSVVSLKQSNLLKM